MKTLTLHVKGEYFDDMVAGTKLFEYRLRTPYWEKRLNQHYDQVMICKGYPKSDDMSRRLVRPWHGFTITTIQHKHFGPERVQVFAIAVNLPEPVKPEIICGQEAYDIPHFLRKGTD